MKLDEKRIREDRARVWSGMAELIEKADLEKRSLTVDEAAVYDQRETELKQLDAELERVKTYNSRVDAEREVAEQRGQSTDEVKDRRENETRAFTQFLRRGMGGVDPSLRPLLEKRAVYDAGLNEGGFQASGTAGGFTVPQGFWDNLQIALKQYGGIMPYCRLVTTAAGNPMDWPTTDPTAVVGAIIGEGVQDTYNDYVFGQGILNAWTYTSKLILASFELVNDSAFDIDSFVRDRIGEAIGRAFAAHLITGTGSGQPLGVQTALAAVGVVAGANGGVFASAATSTVGLVNTIGKYAATPATDRLVNGLVGFDDILSMISKVDPAYRATGRARFFFNDTTLAALRSIADGYGHPLWNPNVQSGAGDDLYGYPYTIDQNMPNVSTTASTTGGLIFGDLQTAMVVRRVNQADVLRLNERYADARQVGYFGFVRQDARSNDLRAAVVYRSPAS